MDETPVFLDANIFVYATLNYEDLGDKARGILRAITQGEKTAAVSPLIWDEVLWAVWRIEGREAALEAVSTYLSSLPLINLDLPGNLFELALEFIEQSQLKPRDALHAATMHHYGFKKCISNDSDFDRVLWLERVEI